MSSGSVYLSSKRSQQGAVLFISLIFLLVMTFLALRVYQSSTQQLQMADNSGSKSLAFQAAESARSYAESLMNDKANSLSQGTDYSCETSGYYASAEVISELGILGCSEINLSSMKWDNTDSFVVPDVSDQRYAIEFMGADEVLEPYAGVQIGVGTGTGSSEMIDVYVFRILTQGRENAGGNVVLQSIFIARKSS